ncbi:MAG: MerR family transcriptional regulator [Faecalibacterium sp.]|nr:MerR family transcriptional regulator [Faecalibacterium sp.]
MKINQVETAVGITKKNIRFYEEEGLLRPRRNAANGYREYSDEDVARLRRIKLLRKLDVPLAEIREMLDGSVSLSEGMRRHADELEQRQNVLAASMEFCAMLQQTPGMLDALDAEETLRRLTEQEEQGVHVVNVEKTDRKAERYQGAVIGAALFIALMLFLVGLMVWACLTDPAGAPPPAIMAFLIGLPIACIIGVMVVLVDRIKQIGKGEEDAYRHY